MIHVNMLDFTSPAAFIFKTLQKNNSHIEERDAIALIALSLRSFYEKGFEMGRNFEQYGSYEKDSPKFR